MNDPAEIILGAGFAWDEFRKGRIASRLTPCAWPR